MTPAACCCPCVALEASVRAPALQAPQSAVLATAGQRSVPSSIAQRSAPTAVQPLSAPQRSVPHRTATHPDTLQHSAATPSCSAAHCNAAHRIALQRPAPQHSAHHRRRRHCIRPLMYPTAAHTTAAQEPCHLRVLASATHPPPDTHHVPMHPPLPTSTFPTPSPGKRSLVAPSVAPCLHRLGAGLTMQARVRAAAGGCHQ